MSVTLEDSDSSDSDVFVIKQIKPINKLTLQQALIIKHGVLKSFQCKNNSALNKSIKKKKKDNLDTPEKLQKLRKKKNKKSTASFKSSKSEDKKSTKDVSNETKIKCTVKRKSLDIHCENEEILIEGFMEDIETQSLEIIKKPTKQEKEEKSPKITNYFSSTEVTPEKQKEKKKIDIDENFTLSPGVSRKRKKFKMFKDASPKSTKYNHSVRKTFEEASVKKKLPLTFNNESFINELRNDDFGDIEKFKDVTLDNKPQTKDLLAIISSSMKEEEGEKYKGNSELICFLFKKIIRDETKKQIILEEKSLSSRKPVGKLLSEKDCEILERFFNLDENACKVYVRMLCRKKDWHRLSTISYLDIDGDLQQEFELLSANNFIDVNIEEEDLITQMDLLSKLEVIQLSKAFNVKTKICSSSKKNELIKFLIEDCKNQKSVLDMMQIKKRGSRVDILKSEIKNILGMCVKLNEAVMSTFKKIMLLFSFAHYYDEEDKRFSNQLFMCMKVYKNMISFPKYMLSPTVVFETKCDFEQYEKALSLLECFDIAIVSKQHENFKFIGNQAKEEFCNIINDKKYQKRFIHLAPFLKKFSAGTIYAKILTEYCSKFKKKSDSKEIISIIQTLLGQNLFLSGKRGKWYEILSQAYETLRKNSAAAEVLIRSLNDPCIDEVQKLALQLRGQALLKKKTNCVEETNLREMLDDLCTISVQEPASIEIKGKALQGNEAGYKCVYIEENENGKMYTSVEEKAILYYKSNGFTNGCHSEGFIVQSIYFLLFFDIIYGLSPPGVFQSLYQEAPLDFYSKSFYLNRKEAIDSLLNEMCKWTEEEVEIKLKAVYNQNFNVSCVITWKEHFTPEFFCEIIKCITMPVLARICQRLVRNFKVARSGFPDLTLWNSETKKCKFVEVKSPNDKLSPAQRVWLDYLRNIGIDCEVCNVKNISSKSF